VVVVEEDVVVVLASTATKNKIKIDIPHES